ncbi:MAG: SOS response-associated peptidase [Burkholderiales bacterium]|nr:SOS response-associated peptidase [Burkholderiales bacterium]
MCGRYVSPDEAAIERRFHIGRHDGNPFPARYNVAPQQGNPANFVPVVRADRDGALEVARLQWWLLPFWSKEPRIRHATFNARVETVAKLASFREPLRRRRCVVPALGWYEWQELPGGNLPWYLHGAHGEVLALAGLWDRWERNGQVIESCTIVVGPANAAFMPVHDRMPFVLCGASESRWLDRGLTSSQEALALLQPNPEEALRFHRVDKAVSNARNQGPALIREIESGG